MPLSPVTEPQLQHEGLPEQEWQIGSLKWSTSQLRPTSRPQAMHFIIPYADSVNADVLLARCEGSSELYGIRAEDRSDAWYATWTFTVDQRRAGREHYGNTVVNARLLLGDGFPGCPHCAAGSFVKCNQCGHITCWDGAVRVWSCRWTPCQSSGVPAGSIQSFHQHGDL
jgi:hypothetical protein